MTKDKKMEKMIFGYVEGGCLEAVGVTLGDERDAEGRSRFYPIGVSGQILILENPDLAPWFQDLAYHPARRGLQCCSPTGISLHYVDGLTMYTLEYAIYHLRTRGVDR